MHMPGMNGITLAEVIKADPRTRARAADYFHFPGPVDG